jgi:hypothetical protein
MGAINFYKNGLWFYDPNLQIFKAEKNPTYFFKNGQTSYSRSLQPLKENIHPLKHEISSLFSIFMGHFALLNSDPADQNQSGSMGIRIHHTVHYIVLLFDSRSISMWCW